MRVTAEMRWFWLGQCPPDLESWFFKSSPRAGGGEPRCDQYVRPEPTQGEQDGCDYLLSLMR